MYDKAISILINPELMKHFSNNELKKSVKLQMINSLLKDNLIVDKLTKYQYQILGGEQITVSCRAYRV